MIGSPGALKGYIGARGSSALSSVDEADMCRTLNVATDMCRAVPPGTARLPLASSALHNACSDDNPRREQP
ncbi:hypothetical protein GCM10010336_53700 [Streptomyces goshikiensis]|nr:hypothetical protein GCM10010336_53700 [Streptomyces goshikiensis]